MQSSAGIVPPTSAGGRNGVKALTLRQPWASLVATGRKAVETRGWSTRYRGCLAIHAGLARPSIPPALRLALGEAGAWPPEDLPRGVVLAVVRLVDCRVIGADGRPEGCALDAAELAFGDYRPGRFAWLLEDVRALGVPVAARGALGLWEWPGA